MVILGVLLGATVCTLSPTQTPDGLWFIFLSGAIAICAMILPGISGSFILLILGKYQYMMGCISDLVSGTDVTRNLLILGVFAAGALVGIIGFSKLLHWLLARWNKEVLIVMAGFIIGSLVKIWPWGNPEAMLQAERAGGLLWGWALLFAIIGFSLVTIIEITGKRLNRKQQA
jgi:putative membrane protein